MHTGRSTNPIRLKGADLPSDRERAMGVVRLQLSLVVLASTLLALVTGALLGALLLPDAGQRASAAVRGAPVAWLAVGLVAVVLACALMLRLASRVVEAARQPEPAPRSEHDHPVPAGSPALIDALTGLGNHRAFQEELERQLDLSREHGHSLVLVLLDLDDFGALNKSAGHATGDLLLGEMSRLMRTVLRRSDLPFRTGGDEFAILLPHLSVENGYQVTRRLLAAALAPRPGGPFATEFSFSAGVTGAPELGSSRAQLEEQASEALARGKHEGRTLIKVYDPEHSTRTQSGPSLERASAAVAALVEQRAVQPVYQPIIELATERVVGFEGLARPMPESGFDNPVSLFAAAEAAGRTIELDRLCIETLLAGAGALQPDQWLSLNISPRTLEAPEFSAAWLGQLLQRAVRDPRQVVLEVTERDVKLDVELVRERLASCQAMGVRIAIDNVGAGNMGLRLLSEIRFDIVKIDLSLVQSGARQNTSRDVLSAIAELAGRWGATVLAAGVETPAELRLIGELGLPEAQGFLLGRPSPAPELRSVTLEPLLHELDLRLPLGGDHPGWPSDLARARLGGGVAG